jgi:glycosyltransferase involved in cell wall biosynthesis
VLTVAITVPTYNRADLIAETLDSLLAQTRPADEIFVVDDGSTDDTQSVLARYAGRIRAIRVPNSGELSARNLTLRESTCDLMAFCDSDDLWEPDALQTLASQWQTTPDLIACYADFRILRGGALEPGSKFDGAPAGFWDGIQPSGPEAGVFRLPIVEKLLHYQPFFPSCMMVHRTRFLTLGAWDEGVARIVGNDFATVLRVAMHPPIGVVRRPLVSVRKHAGNFSADTEQMNLGDADVLDHVLRSRPELALLGPQIRASAALRRGQAMDSAYTRQDFAEVRRIAALMPKGAATTKQNAKRAIAALPPPLARLAAELLSR